MKAVRGAGCGGMRSQGMGSGTRLWTRPLPPASSGYPPAPGKARAATREEQVGRQGSANKVQEPHPRPETSGALSRAGRSPTPPHPRRLCRHSRLLLSGSLLRSPRHWHLLAGRSALTSRSHTADSRRYRRHPASSPAQHSAPPFSRAHGAHPPAMAWAWDKDRGSLLPKPG